MKDTLYKKGSDQIKFWIVALVLGVLSGITTVLFRKSIATLQAMFYGADDLSLASVAKDLPWFWVLLLPVIGGLLVGIILHVFIPDGRIHSISHVIEGAALKGGRVEGKAGFASVFASLVTLSTGGSTGREGPAVQLGSLMSSKLANLINADNISGRELLGCAVAAAVSASFNAPIAGIIFALEVILRHFAIHAFAPITIAAVGGTVVGHLSLGNVTEFSLPEHSAEFYLQLPAFIILGILCGFIAVIVMRAIFLAEDFGDFVQKKFGIYLWARPVIAGVLLGLIAIVFPHIIGVGYETTSKALTGSILFWPAVVFTIVKVIAVAITMAGRMGGGVFSPALMVGALSGLAFGWVVTSIVPSVHGDESLYALAGMGAVGAAILGAPLSTCLIVFEMTGDWQAGLAVLVAVSLSSSVASSLVNRSFFLTQLERKGVHLAAGPQSYLLATFSVQNLMRPVVKLKPSRQRKLQKKIKTGVYLEETTTLEFAFPIFQSGAHKSIPVVRHAKNKQEIELLGALYYVDALAAYNSALAKTAHEEHS